MLRGVRPLREVPDEVRIKSAYCYIRVLHNLLDLLKDKTFSIKLEEGHKKCLLQDVKNGRYSYGQIIDMGTDLRKDCTFYLTECDQYQNYELPAGNLR